MLYSLLKHTHVTLAAASILFFLTRVYWSCTGSKTLGNPWARISPHVIDSLLLFSAIGLAVISQQYPLQQDWLTAKVLALCCYIALGSLAVKRAPTPRPKALFAALALLTYAYIIAVAVTKNPTPL